jgi:hypothetical protein
LQRQRWEDQHADNARADERRRTSVDMRAVSTPKWLTAVMIGSPMLVYQHEGHPLPGRQSGAVQPHRRTAHNQQQQKQWH